MRTILPVVIATAFFAGCGDDDDTRRVLERQWNAAPRGIGEWENLEGDVIVVATDGFDEFRATATLRNDQPGAVRPWHVHFGTCATGGDIVGDDDDYPRLEIGSNGMATATANVDERLDPARDYHVNVHLSEEEMDTIIACGNLFSAQVPDPRGPDAGAPEPSPDAGAPEPSPDAGAPEPGPPDDLPPY